MDEPFDTIERLEGVTDGWRVAGVSGGEKYQRDAVRAAAELFGRRRPALAASVLVELRKIRGAWGWCEQRDGDYLIELDERAGLRVLVQTLMHELQHVVQYETNEWSGDGEEQAEAAEALADEVWLSGQL